MRNGKISIGEALREHSSSFEEHLSPDPASFRGHKVEVKGFWIQGSNQHINVNSLQTLPCSDVPEMIRLKWLFTVILRGRHWNIRVER
jgi:hypothetical protein